ncbi:hypothetical protein LSTR_LSTR014160 [Laodelphax striatellus]|uniref:Uncharacterized protein n=1 Tax=Laodelphax striatellus TaxID=195883 RepID=A0A482X3N0_LAOST|nr:hypothetical protein LSTR_LSTR014160 [Laodelphax striatellus]
MPPILRKRNDMRNVYYRRRIKTLLGLKPKKINKKRVFGRQNEYKSDQSDKCEKRENYKYFVDNIDNMDWGATGSSVNEIIHRISRNIGERKMFSRLEIRSILENEFLSTASR